MNTATAAIRPADSVQRRLSLEKSPDLFLRTYRELDVRTHASPILQMGRFDSSTETRVRTTVEEMESHGCSLWPNFLQDPDDIEALRNLVSQTHHRAQRLFAEVNTKCCRIDDPKTGWRFRRGALAAQEGITRADFWPGQTTIPDEILKVWRDPRMTAVISRYYRRPTKITHAIAERVFPSLSTDLFGWHIDRLMDQSKVMILLCDVDERNAPFRYRADSHRGSEDKKILLHNYFTHGVKYSELSASLAKSIGSETRTFTGKAGDAVFFDTCGIHVRSMCYDGTRDVLNFNFTDPQTPKNRFFNQIRGDQWM